MKQPLFSKFSEEQLAAFIDGRLTPSEMSAMQRVLSSDNDIQKIINDVSDSGIEQDGTAFDDFPEFSPEQTLGQLLPFVEQTWQDGLSVDDITFDAFDIPHPIFNEQTGVLNTMATTDYRIYGESGENINDPIYIQQPDDHSCALRSQQIILRDFGIDIPFEDLEQIALEAGVYSEKGTYTYDIGKVLEIAGVGMHQVYGSTIFDLTHELSQGHRVIVSVDADELWYNDRIVDKAKNWLNDVIGKQGGNHALIVAGVEVNPDNPNDVKVVLTDPGSGGLRIEYPLDQFMDAWQDSHCFMAATDLAAPYQFDASTGMEVPSNFAAQQFYNQFIIEHSYQLNPDSINVPSGYQPAFQGHLDMVGDVTYEDFNDKYEELQEARQQSEENQHGIVGNAIHSLIGDLKSLFSYHNDNYVSNPFGEGVGPQTGENDGEVTGTTTEDGNVVTGDESDDSHPLEGGEGIEDDPGLFPASE